MHIQHEIELEESREWVGENLVFFTPSQLRGGWGRGSKLTGGGGGGERGLKVENFNLQGL